MPLCHKGYVVTIKLPLQGHVFFVVFVAYPVISARVFVFFLSYSGGLASSVTKIEDCYSVLPAAKVETKKVCGLLTASSEYFMLGMKTHYILLICMCMCTGV